MTHKQAMKVTDKTIAAVAAPRERARRSRVYQRKTDVVLTAAESLFQRFNFVDVAMEDVAAEAGVSKSTVYRNFGSKEQLFQAVIRHRCAHILPDTATIAEAERAKPADGLRILSIAFLHWILAPAQIEFFRSVIASVRRAPEVGRMLFEGPMQRSRALFADYIGRRIAVRPTSADEADRLASQLIALLSNQTHMQLVLGCLVELDEARITADVDHALSLFLAGVI